jgi:hypothetical protein
VSRRRWRTLTRHAATASHGGSNTGARGGRPCSPRGPSTWAGRASHQRRLRRSQRRFAHPGGGRQNADHVCDLTEIGFTVTETDKPGRVWGLAAGVADSVLDGNPHADRHGNKDVWSFVRGPSRPGGKTEPLIRRTRSSAGGGRRLQPRTAGGSCETGRAATDVAVQPASRQREEPRPHPVRQPGFRRERAVSGTQSVSRSHDLGPRCSDWGRIGSAATRKVSPPTKRTSWSRPTASPRYDCRRRLFRDREFVVEGRLDGAR